MLRSQKYEIMSDVARQLDDMRKAVKASGQREVEGNSVYLYETALRWLGSAVPFVFDFNYIGMVDAIQPDEFEILKLLPLPHPVCLFEVVVPPSGDQERPYKGAFILARERGKRGEVWKEVSFFFHSKTAEWKILNHGFLLHPEDGLLQPAKFLRAVANRSEITDDIFRNCFEFAPLVMDMVLSINAKTTSVSKEEYVPLRDGPKSFKEKRAQKAVIPRFSYNYVDIGLSSGAKDRINGSSLDESRRASPRLHWRRAHMRTLPDGRRVPVQRALIGLAERGVVLKEYRVHMPSADDTVH